MPHMGFILVKQRQKYRPKKAKHQSIDKDSEFYSSHHELLFQFYLPKSKKKIGFWKIHVFKALAVFWRCSLCMKSLLSSVVVVFQWFGWLLFLKRNMIYKSEFRKELIRLENIHLTLLYIQFICILLTCNI